MNRSGFKVFILNILLFICYSTQAVDGVVGSLPGHFKVTTSGAAEYTIPIDIPPALSGLQPNLALVYNSNRSPTSLPMSIGDINPSYGMLGQGWALRGLSSIYRCQTDVSRDGYVDAVDYDANDKFCLDGQRLILVSGEYGSSGSEYRTEVNGYQKIVAQGAIGSGPASFKVVNQLGQTIEFGASDSARQSNYDGDEIRYWNISTISDASGNRITFDYLKDVDELTYKLNKISYEQHEIMFEYDTSNLLKINVNSLNAYQYHYIFGYELSDWARFGAADITSDR